MRYCIGMLYCTVLIIVLLQSYVGQVQGGEGENIRNIRIT